MTPSRQHRAVRCQGPARPYQLHVAPARVVQQGGEVGVQGGRRLPRQLGLREEVPQRGASLHLFAQHHHLRQLPVPHHRPDVAPVLAPSVWLRVPGPPGGGGEASPQRAQRRAARFLLPLPYNVGHSGRRRRSANTITYISLLRVRQRGAHISDGRAQTAQQPAHGSSPAITAAYLLRCTSTLQYCMNMWKHDYFLHINTTEHPHSVAMISTNDQLVNLNFTSLEIFITVIYVK